MTLCDLESILQKTFVGIIVFISSAAMVGLLYLAAVSIITNAEIFLIAAATVLVGFIAIGIFYMIGNAVSYNGDTYQKRVR